MKRLMILLSLLLALTGCAAGGGETDELKVACTTYPVYLLAREVTRGVEGVEVTLVVNQQVSCLHDYTLTVTDMKLLEGADAVAVNGAGLEDFLGDALEGKTVIDCDEDIPLLDAGEHHADGDHHEEDHHHEGADPHIWMNPDCYARMAQNLASGLAALDTARADTYRANGEAVAERLERFYQTLRDSEAGRAVAGLEIITFHDGFSYFANAFDLHIAAAIEEEEGAEASARDLRETIAIVESHNLPAVFTEVNGSGHAAEIICAECGIRHYPLSMVMSGGAEDDLRAYEAALTANIETIREAYQ